MTTAPYIWVATVLERLNDWWDAKREEWELTKLLVDEVAAGYVPSPESVGLTTTAATAEPCGTCDGTGRLENDAESMWAPMWVDCCDCEGAGTVPSTSGPNDCVECGGTGLIEHWTWTPTGRAWGAISCWSCRGKGERGAA